MQFVAKAIWSKSRRPPPHPSPNTTRCDEDASSRIESDIEIAARLAAPLQGPLVDGHDRSSIRGQISDFARTCGFPQASCHFVADGFDDEEGVVHTVQSKLKDLPQGAARWL